jgi:hypothetical protein
MILLAVILLTITAVSMFSLAVLDWRDAYREHRSEQANLERQKRWAERRLHDVSSKAFGEMLDAARQASGSDRPWGS